MKNKILEVLKEFNGCEFGAPNDFEEIVGLRGDTVICNGAVVETIKTIKRANEIIDMICADQNF